MTCPECFCEENVYDGFTVKDITTADDTELGLVRLALRCEACGFATAFVAKENTE